MLFEDLTARISHLRNEGKLSEAAYIAVQGISQFPTSYFLPKLAGDLYSQMGDTSKAAEYYLEFLHRIPANEKLFGDFARRYYKLKREMPPHDFAEYARSILNRVREGYFSYGTANRAITLTKYDVPFDNTFTALGEELNSLLQQADDSNFLPIVQKAKDLEAQNSAELISILDSYLLRTIRGPRALRIDTFLISVYERNNKHENALKLAFDLLSVSNDSIVIRALLRISRKLGNYGTAEMAMRRYPDILKSSSFNVLYELVYYYEHLNDLDKLKATLTLMEKRSSQSLPILTTLRNFYLRFGFYEEAKRADELVVAKRRSAYPHRLQSPFSEELEESQKELRSEFENRTRLAAITDLTTGISHELGQPITNIRYTVQFYKKMLDNQPSKDQINEVFDSILEETERMGQLVKRLAPITSSKSLIENFDLTDRIRKRVRAESTRLEQLSITVSIEPSSPLMLNADPVKFDQIIGNLLLNSIDSLQEKTVGPRAVSIVVTPAQDTYKISFEDNGVGIPLKHRGRMFEPFFTTKSPGRGTGLGLFIVWNIMKMFGGSITLDSTYENGARFVATMPKDTTKYNRDSG